MISTWHSKGRALSSVGSKRSHTSIRTLGRRSFRSEIRTDITLRSVRSLGLKLSSPRPITRNRNMKPKNTICLWFDKDALAAARFYAATFPDSKVTAVHNAPGDYPSGNEGDVLTVEFTVLGIPCLGLNGGP